MISDEIGLRIMNECEFDDYTFANPHNVTDSCNQALAEANSIIGDYINSYDVILDVCYPSIVSQELRLRKMVGSFFSSYFLPLFIPYCKFHICTIIFYSFSKYIQATKISLGVDVCMTYERRFYFNLPEVQKALHANRTNLPDPWSMCSE